MAGDIVTDKPDHIATIVALIANAIFGTKDRVWGQRNELAILYEQRMFIAVLVNVGTNHLAVVIDAFKAGSEA
jgi:hypothetical protein